VRVEIESENEIHPGSFNLQPKILAKHFTPLTSGVVARNRVRDLNEYNKINLKEIRRKNMPDDGVFNVSQNSNHDLDNDVESNDSQANLKDIDDNVNNKYFWIFHLKIFLSFKQFYH